MDGKTSERLAKLTEGLVASQGDRRLASKKNQAQLIAAQREEIERTRRWRKNVESDRGPMSDEDWLDYIRQTPEESALPLKKEMGGWKRGRTQPHTRENFR